VVVNVGTLPLHPMYAFIVCPLGTSVTYFLIPYISAFTYHWPGHEADHSPPSTEVKNVWSYTSTPHYASMAGAQLKNTGTTSPLPLPRDQPCCL
jgi:hypothetical protein